MTGEPSTIPTPNLVAQGWANVIVPSGWGIPVRAISPRTATLELRSGAKTPVAESIHSIRSRCWRSSGFFASSLRGVVPLANFSRGCCFVVAYNSGRVEGIAAILILEMADLQVDFLAVTFVTDALSPT